MALRVAASEACKVSSTSFWYSSKSSVASQSLGIHNVEAKSDEHTPPSVKGQR